MSTPVKDPQEQYRLAEQLLLAVKSKNLTEVFKALDAGADPTDYVGSNSAYSYLLSKFVGELPAVGHQLRTAGEKPFSHMLTEILLKTRISIPEDDAPWSSKCRYTIREMFNTKKHLPSYVNLKHLSDGIERYNVIKAYAAYPDMPEQLREGNKLRWCRLNSATSKRQEVIAHKLLLEGANLLVCPMMFREMISDETLWATRADAAAYMESVIALKRFDRVRPQDQWVNRLLESWQADTPLAKYARDEFPVPGGKR